MISVPFASGVLRRLGQRSRESFWSLFVELFLCLECPSLDRVTRLVSSTATKVGYHGLSRCLRAGCSFSRKLTPNRNEASDTIPEWQPESVNKVFKNLF